MYFKKSIFALLLTTLTACGGSDDSSSDGDPTGDVANQSPTVDAGSNFTAAEKTTVELNATASDADGNIASISWSQVAGTSVQLKRPNQLNPVFDAPDVKPSETLSFEITVTDNSGSSSKDTVDVLVEHINAMPSASFSETEYSANEKSETELTVDASDSDGEVTSYSWSQISGEEVTIQDPTAQTILFVTPTVMEETELEFEVAVVDDEGGTTKTSIVLTVLPVNELPLITMDASLSAYPGSVLPMAPTISDIDGEIVSVQWSLPSGENITITDTGSAESEFILPDNLAAGDVEVLLTVTDNEGGVVTHTLMLEVQEPLRFVSYSGDVDPEPLLDVNMDVELAESSNITLATQAENGYTTHSLDSTDFEYTLVGNVLTVLNNPQGVSLNNGDIVTITDDETNEGILKKIIAQGSFSNEYIVGEASLVEAFPNADIQLSFSFSNSDEARGNPNQVSAMSQSEQLDLLSFERTIEHQIDTGIKSVTKLSMNSNLTVDFDISILQAEITELKTLSNTSYVAESHLEVTLPYEYSRNYTREFNPIFEANRVVQIGAVPVLVNFKAVPVLGAGVELSSAADAKYGFRADGDIEAGFVYENGVMNKVANFNPQLTKIGPEITSINGGAKLTAKAKIMFVVSLYDIELDVPVIDNIEFSGPGVGVDVGPEGKFEVSASYDPAQDPAFTCLLDLTVGMSSHLSIDYGTIGQYLEIENTEGIVLYSSASPLWTSNECPFEAQLGQVSGTIYDRESLPVQDVSITVYNSNGAVSNTSSSEAGDYLFEDLPIGTYSVEFAKEGYLTATADVEILANADVVLPQVLFADEGDVDVGMVNISVVDSQNPGQLLAGAEIIVREGLNAPSGDYVERYFSETIGLDIELDTGYYTIEVRKDGFETEYRGVTVLGDEPQSIQINLSSEDDTVTGDEARIVLTWGATPSDLDSHLTYDGKHVYYGNPSEAEADLDVDDTSSFGPETITIYQVEDTESYRYYVYNYSRSGTFSASGAQIKLYYDGTTRTYNAPTGSGYYWNVFSIVNGQVEACRSGCVSDSAPAALRNLPVKAVSE